MRRLVNPDSLINHNLVLVRHGESIWNRQKRWAGWTDISLSSSGVNQAKQCGKLLKAYEFDEVYTSVLTRSIKTLNYILDQLDTHYLPVHKCWRLNEKHYGSLQGEKKKGVYDKYGSQIVHQWRRSLNIRPPALDIHDERHPTHDNRYQSLQTNQLPSSQCLNDIVQRVRPLWQQQISNKINQGAKLLIVAHGSSLRALIKLIANTNDEETKQLNIPNATPIIYTLTNDNLKPINIQYLGDQEQIKAKMYRIKNQLNQDINI